MTALKNAAAGWSPATALKASLLTTLQLHSPIVDSTSDDGSAPPAVYACRDPGGMVLLRCAPSLRMTKLIAPSVIAGMPPVFQPYDNAFRFDATERPHGNLHDIFVTLQRAQRKYRFCAIRGRLIGRTTAEGIRRLSNPDKRTGDQPTIQDASRLWIALDVDSIPIPSSVDRRDIEECGRSVIAQLPREFHNVAVIVQATASHSFKPGARLRLWYWLERPLTGAECQNWLKGVPVDPAVFRPSEPIYTAAPIFAGGLKDPLPTRLVMLPGSGAVPVPPSEALTVVPVQRRRSLHTKARTCVQDDPSNEVALDRVATCLPLSKATLNGLIRKVVRAPEGQRNSLTYWAACRLGKAVEDGAMTERYAVDVLVLAARYAGLEEQEALATVRSGLAQGQGARQ